MKILVKVLKIEDNTVIYQEINRTTGKAMIEDFMSVDQFINALNKEVFGFELVEMTKQQAIKVAAMFGAVITDWEYCRFLKTFSALVSTKHEYDNGYGYMCKELHITTRSQNTLCSMAIIEHHTYKGD